LRIIADNQEIYQDSFEFQPHWQPKTFEITVNNLHSSVNSIEIIVENNDEIKNTMIIYENPESFFSQFGAIILILGSFMVAVPVIIITWKKVISKRKYLKENSE